MSEATEHDRVREPKEVQAKVPASLEPFIELVAELIAEEKLKEVEFQVKGADYDSQHPLQNRETDLCSLPDRVR